MEKWQLRRLIETDELDQEIEIGGALIEMKIGAVTGPLNSIEVRPVSVEEMKDVQWAGQFVRLQIADRVVWLEPNEVRALVRLLKRAHDASLGNYAKANPES